MRRCADCRNGAIGTREQGIYCIFHIDPDQCGNFEPKEELSNEMADL